MVTSLAVRRIVSKHFSRLQTRRHNYRTSAILMSAEESKLPRIVNPSFWSSLIPRFLRRSSDEEKSTSKTKKEDVAAAQERRIGLIFLFLGILVGSNAINIISIRRDTLNFSRLTDAKLELLREIVQRIKNGEDVDVKKELGTGDPAHEKEWEEVMHELEHTDMLAEGRKKRGARRVENADTARSKDQDQRASSNTESRSDTNDSTPAQNPSRPKFVM